MHLSPEERLQHMLDRIWEEEELVAQCMSEQGFDYTPWQSATPIVTGVEWRPDDRDWVAEWGFAIVRQDELRADEEHPEPQADPNAERIAGYSPTHREAWIAALEGDWEAMPLDEDGHIVFDWEQAGCRGWAGHQVSQEQDLHLREEFAPLFEAIDELQREVFWDGSSPHLAEAHQEWAACMTHAGHGGFRNPNELRMDIWDRLDSIERSGVSGPRSAYPPIVELAELEVTLALADFDCREEIDFDARAAAAREAAELEFIATHRDLLTALRDAAEQGG